LRDVLAKLFQGTEETGQAPAEKSVDSKETAIAEESKAGNEADGEPASEIILVVDDTETNLMFAEHLLGKIAPDAEIETASNAAEAIEAVQSQKFGLILMDIEMPPGMNGIDAAAQIRTFDKNTCIVALTGHDDAGIMAKCAAAGMNGVAQKPFREAELSKIVLTFYQQDAQKMPWRK